MRVLFARIPTALAVFDWYMCWAGVSMGILKDEEEQGNKQIVKTKGPSGQRPLDKALSGVTTK
jgi:hypothetical protein